MPDYAAHWQGLLTEKGTEGVDLLASLSESAVNEFLTKHFSLDNVHYSKTITKSFNDGAQIREFTLTLEVAGPLKVDFPPFASLSVFNDANGWNEVEHRDPKDRGTLTTSNIRITCDAIKFKINWPNLKPPPANWEWVPNPIKMVAEAYLWLDYFEGRHRVLIEPTRIKFDPTNLLAQLKLAGAGDPCEMKFNDLLVIALNVAAYEFGPSLVRAVEIPGFKVAGLPIYPALLNLSNSLVTIGASVDQPTLQANVNKAVEPLIARYLALLDEDLERASKAYMFPADGLIEGVPITQQQVEAILARSLPRSRAYVADVMAQSERTYAAAIAGKPFKTGNRDVKAAAVAEGIGVALDEYFVDTLLPRFLNKQEEGSREVDLGAVKGGIRWWFRIWNPDASFQNTDIVGSADIDIGGAIFACVRKFWDCSWRWECGEISLGVSGRPSIRLMTSNVNDGIAIRAKIQDRPKFTNNLPFPFDKIVNAVGDLVVEAIVAIINLILSRVVIVVMGVEIAIPNMKTKIKLSSFSRFTFQRDATKPVAFPANKQKFLGAKASVEAG